MLHDETAEFLREGHSETILTHASLNEPCLPHPKLQPDRVATIRIPVSPEDSDYRPLRVLRVPMAALLDDRISSN